MFESPLLAVHAEEEEDAAEDAVAQSVSPQRAATQGEDGEEKTDMTGHGG